MRYELKKDITTATIGEGIGLLDAESGKYYVLNQTAAEVWALLKKGPKSIEELVDILIMEYQEDKLIIGKHVENLLLEFEERKFVNKL